MVKVGKKQYTLHELVKQLEATYYVSHTDPANESDALQVYTSGAKNYFLQINSHLGTEVLAGRTTFEKVCEEYLQPGSNHLQSMQRPLLISELRGFVDLSGTGKDAVYSGVMLGSIAGVVLSQIVGDGALHGIGGAIVGVVTGFVYSANRSNSSAFRIIQQGKYLDGTIEQIRNLP